MFCTTLLIDWDRVKGGVGYDGKTEKPEARNIYFTLKEDSLKINLISSKLIFKVFLF